MLSLYRGEYLQTKDCTCTLGWTGVSMPGSHLLSFCPWSACIRKCGQVFLCIFLSLSLPLAFSSSGVCAQNWLQSFEFSFKLMLPLMPHVSLLRLALLICCIVFTPSQSIKSPAQSLADTGAKCGKVYNTCLWPMLPF